jgi:hypothetical protein
MSLDELSPNRSAVKRLWKKVEDGVLDSFFQDIEAELTERYEQLLNDKSESLIQRLWELQLEQGFNTVKGEALFYPRGTKFFYHTDQKTIVVVEQPPLVRTLTMEHSLHKDGRAQIALPYVNFVFMFDQTADEFDTICTLEACHCYFANESLTSMDTEIAIAALPNIHINGAICWGGNIRTGDDYGSEFILTSKNLIDFIEKSITYFWTSEFNEDLPQHYQNNFAKTPKLRFEKWAKETEKNPFFVTGVKWLDPITLKRALMLMPGSDHYRTEINLPPANSYAVANNQIDDVYCSMMQKQREAVQDVMLAAKKHDAFEGLQACFDASVSIVARHAHEQFLGALKTRIRKLPSYRREDVENCIEESLKAAMMAVRQ